MPLMPLPKRIRTGGARRRLNDGGWAFFGAITPRLAAAQKRLAAQLQRQAGAAGCGLPVRISCGPSAAFPALDDDESYRLRIDANGARIDAPEEWGALRAFATLQQLLAADAEGPHLPEVEIEDAPRFPWRGLMVDTARRFISLRTLRRTLDAMAFYKLNVLHLHLSDDQAFRFHGAACPELAHPRLRYGASELRGLARYAAARGIRVVPELDVPGHAASWLAQHPAWGIGAAPEEPSRRFGVHACCLNPNAEDAMQAVEALFEELAQTFPDAFAHFGGDEVQLPEGEDAAALQAEFNQRLTATLRTLGKRPMAWDEAMHPNLPRDVAIQAWRGPFALKRALAAGFDAVCSGPWYLDLFYPADLHYAFDPASGEGPSVADDPRLEHVREGLQRLEAAWRSAGEDAAAAPASGGATPQGRVLGGEACMWTELVSDALFDVRVWSRLPAIAERFWSSAPDADGSHLASESGVYERMAATQGQLARAGTLNLDAALRRNLRKLGLTATDIVELMPLVEMLEPVKWYARLLGSEGLASRAAGQREEVARRPYDADTPLDRMVDVIPPESLAARRFGAEQDAARLKAAAAGWQRQRQWLERRREALPAIVELDAPSAMLRVLGVQLEGWLRGEPAEVPPRALQPFGEYMLPVARPLAVRFA